VIKHGMAESPEFASWMKMIARCEDPKNNRFPRYGGRGIRVCGRWRSAFLNFFTDMGFKPTPKHSIDRIDNDGNYEPGNCRWATATQQLRNYSLNKTITAFGEKKVLSEWAADPRCAVKYMTLAARLHRKDWTPEDMITKRPWGVRHEHGRKPRRKSA
jgi:hypothetical protein